MSRPSILNNRERKTIIMIGDLLITLIALNVFLDDALDNKLDTSLHKILFFIVGGSIYLFLAYTLDFYNLEKLLKTRTNLSQSFYIVGAYVLTIFVGTVIFFDSGFWRIPLLVFMFLTPAAIFLWRFFFSNLFKLIPTTRNVLYVFDSSVEGDHANIINLINGDGIESFYRTKMTYPIENLRVLEKGKFIRALDNIDSFIINLKSYDNLPSNFQKLLIQTILDGKEVISFTTFYENIYEALPIKSHNDSFYEILRLKNSRIRYFQSLFTYSINFLFAVFVGIFFILACPFVLFMNIFLNKGPLFYSQYRVGQNGKEFKIYKFRSMVVGAEEKGAKMASKNDSRVTPFGKFLRMFRIDELPQFISLIKGDMQFIGPRPERKIFVDKLTTITPFYDARHLIKPGITGWAQVKYKYGEDLEDSIRKLEYDLYYIKNRSISLDLRIIFKTITTVLFSRGI